jgi:hypothetical protein
MKAVSGCAVFVAGSVLGAGAGAAAAPSSGTLYGAVTQGPTRPVCSVAEPCDGPAPGVTLSFLRNGHVLGRVVTGRGGVYRIRLSAGSYAVRTSRKPFGTIPSPPSARVLAGRARRVDFAIDTGIR